MDREQRRDRFTRIAGQFAGFEAYDQNGEKIGDVDDLFVDEDVNYEYVGLKMGSAGSRSTLIPWRLATLDNERKRIEVSDSKDHLTEAPTLDNNEEITLGLEEQVYSHFGLQDATTSEAKEAYADYSSDTDEKRVDLVAGEHRETVDASPADTATTESTVETGDRFTMVEGRFPGYEVYDQNGDQIGSLQRLYVDENDQPHYLAVKRDILAMNVELVPFEIATVDEANERIEVKTDKGRVENGPTFYEAQEITPEYEAELRSHYGL